jgi:hypothetical protein
VTTYTLPGGSPSGFNILFFAFFPLVCRLEVKETEAVVLGAISLCSVVQGAMLHKESVPNLPSRLAVTKAASRYVIFGDFNVIFGETELALFVLDPGDLALRSSFEVG